MESQNENFAVGKEKSTPVSGGLLANVSLLTTGGSSLHQLTNSDPHLSHLKGTTSNTSLKGKKTDDHVDTSTPARAFNTGNIVYGFDLSPVHSYEMPSAALSRKAFRESKSDNEGSKFSLQSRLEEQLFADKNRSAPNFMQAPSVTSSHQSRLSVRKSDDAETMMSQVYSQSSNKSVMKKPSTTSAKSSTKNFKTSSHTPSRVSPRKSSKRYSNVQGSGYGISSSPWNSPRKQKTSAKSKTSPSTKKKSKPSSAEYLSNSALKLLANIKETKDNTKFYSKFENAKGKTYKVAPLRDTTNTTIVEQPSLPDSELNFKEEDMDARHSLEYLTLQERYNTLEVELKKLKEGKEEANKEKFLLSAKLNKLVAVNESADAAIKDSLNEDGKDAEITRLKKEIFEQERLLTSYQQENEKLYKEATKLKIQLRENESAMYKENLKLQSKIARLNEELNEKNAVIRDKNQLILDNENNCRPTINAFAQTEQELLKESSIKVNHNKDKIIAELKQKLENFSGNKSLAQEKDERLERAARNIKELQEEVKSLEHQLGQKNKTWKKEETKEVEDLRRQVKVLEKSLVKAQGNDHVQELLHGSKEKILLEERCEQLETRLKIQEEQFSNNMQSLHNLYKNMSKDYEERLETLSDQLQLVKKNEIMKRVGIRVEEHQKVKEENVRFKSQIERLNRELTEEKNKNINSKTFSKAKKKSRTSANDSSYHPHHFTQRSPVKPEVELLPSQLNHAKQIDELCLEKDGLLKQVVEWKNLYEEAEQKRGNIERSRDAEVERLTVAHQKTIGEFDSNLSFLKEKLSKCDSEISKFKVDLSSSRAREKALHLQVRNLLDELQETRKGSPNATLRQLDALQSQIRMLNFRQKSREEKLDRVVAASADEYTKAEIQSLHQTISEKNLLISKFQCELDSILRALETLQNSRR